LDVHRAGLTMAQWRQLIDEPSRIAAFGGSKVAAEYASFYRATGGLTIDEFGDINGLYVSPDLIGYARLRSGQAKLTSMSRPA
jgi:hypothetical protein